LKRTSLVGGAGKGGTSAKVVFLYHDLQGREESLSYAAELATRMRCHLVLLILLSREAARSAAVATSEQFRTSVEAAFLPHLYAARSARNQVEPALRLKEGIKWPSQGKRTK
jgi:hypothetical protein